jgi:hypothetical protein
MNPSTTFLEYRMSLHREIVATAQGVLDGSIGIVDAARVLAGISFALGAENEEPFISFQGIDSETDHYPLGDVRARWNPDALAREDAERERYEAAIREDAEAACRVLIAKYANVPSD